MDFTTKRAKVLAVGAVAGGVLTALAVYLLALRHRVDAMRLVLVGIGAAALLSSLNSMLIVQANVYDAQSSAVWLIGSLAGANWAQVRLAGGAVLVLIALALALSPRLRTAELADDTEVDPKELAAQKFDLNYVALDGEIGCMVNGAGLAMATLDIIKLYGEEPANFLDVGGGASEEKVTAAFKIITADPQVKGILVNIFGGIMKCDVIAQGIVAAARQVKLSVPLVVRLEGTNVDLGKRILAESGLPIISAANMADAAQKVVAAVQSRTR